MIHRTKLSVIALLASCGVAAPALAQDSVAAVPGNSDAINAYEEFPISRYVVDMVPLTSSWGTQFRIAPILKANADDDPLFTTQLLGSSAVSPDQQTNLNFTPVSYSLWTTPGAGINSVFNTAPGSVNAQTFTRRFGVAFADFASVATNVVGAQVGHDVNQPSRLFVQRVVAASSRYSADPLDANTVTMSLGGIDARGNVFLRADNFGSSGSQVQGENIVRINTPARSNSLATLYNNGSINTSDQPAAISYLISNGSNTTNVPAAISLTTGTGLAAVLDFANQYRANGGAGVTTHIASGFTHRGNPTFSTITNLGGVGTVASLAKANSSARVQSINLFSVSATGAPVANRNATLPTNITDSAGFTSNTAGSAEFVQYLSQTTFRGGSGQVALGLDPLTNTYIAAAVATDPTQGEFVAVARFDTSTVTWTVAAHEGKAILDGPTGTSIGTIANGSPVALSAPSADLYGNIYFVAAYQPIGGPVGTALIKAVNTPSGYRLERLLASGQSFLGANSGRTYTVEKLTLGDSDSVASGTLFAASVLQPTFPGQLVTGPADARAFGGVIVNAKITYNNAGFPETYQSVLFISPDVSAPPPTCEGDANGDGSINFADITSVLSNFGNTATPGSNAPGDANNDGAVNFADVTVVLSRFGQSC